MNMNLAYLGPKFTNGETAAKRFAKTLEGKVAELSLASHDAVAQSVAAGESEYGVLAYFNFNIGLIRSNLDLVYEHRLDVIDVQRIPIVHTIGCPPESEDRSVVYSHPEALTQCSRWLADNLPRCRLEGVTSTAAAAEQVKTTNVGCAIATMDALHAYDLAIIEKDIGNNQRGLNFTDFYLVSKERNRPYQVGKRYVTMIAITPHIDEVGLLHELTGQIRFHGLNIADMIARPSHEDVGFDSAKMFYMEVERHKENPDFKRCLDSLRYKFTPKGKDIEVVRVLGSYEKPSLHQ